MYYNYSYKLLIIIDNGYCQLLRIFLVTPNGFPVFPQTSLISSDSLGLLLILLLPYSYSVFLKYFLQCVRYFHPVADPLVKWLWERVWDFSALSGLTSSVSRRVVKLTVSHYYSAPLPLQKEAMGMKSKSL